MTTAADHLDDGQYSPDEIHKYETIYGRNFISPGGEATTRAILGLAALAPGMLVLDVGSGLGGAAMLMAQFFGVHVHGIDLSSNMLQLARQRCQAAGLGHAISFERADVLGYDRPAAYDLVHSRDVFLHIHAKRQLFAVLARCLRPGGALLFSDYLCRAGPRSPAFADYIASRGYDLRPADEYRLLLEQAGFEVLLAEDRTGEFIDILERELGQLDPGRLSAHDYAALSQSWQDKIARAREGEQRWGVFLARKPA